MSRRSFLRLSGAGLAGAYSLPIPPLREPYTRELGRVAAASIQLYREPSFLSPPLVRFGRDELLPLLKREISDDGPYHNPLWFETPDGYAHSGNLQLVEWRPQMPLAAVPNAGALFEVSVPYTRSYQEPSPQSAPAYRLYYQSTTWVDAVETGDDGRRWYRCLDDALRLHYFARAEHLRLIPAGELSPLAADVPAREKRIRVYRDTQELWAYEGDRVVMRTRISSGIPNPKPRDNGVPTITPEGRFAVHRKVPYRHMGNGLLTADLEDYELPGVPWCMFFTLTGVALHGTYWHTDFGRPRSHGCVNMRCKDAKWLYRWTLPEAPYEQLGGSGQGTLVVVS